MKYNRVLLRNFRGTDHAELELGGGVNVVWGPNEVGKSSIREAIGLLRRYKDSSKAAAIKDVAPIGRDGAPFVELELETGPYALVYRKQWLRRPLTELEVTDGAGRLQHFTGDEAHEHFERLLAETVDLNLLDQVDVAQGDSLHQAKLADVTALQQALGEMPEGDGADVLMERVEKEYREYFTAGGKASGTLRSSREAVERLTTDLDAASERYRAAEEWTAEFAGNERLIEKLAKKLELDRSSLAAAQEENRALEELQGQLELARADAAEAEQSIEALKAERALRVGLEEQIASAAQGVKESGIKAEELTARLAEEVGERAEREEQASAAEKALEVARKKVRIAQDQLSLRRDVEDLNVARRLVARAEAADKRLRTAVKKLASLPVTGEKWAKILECSNRADAAEGAWRAGAPVVTVHPLGERDVAVLGAGEDEVTVVQDSFTTEVLGRLTVDVAGVVKVEVAAGRSPEKLEEGLRSARRELASALQEVGATTVDQAREGNLEHSLAQSEVLRATDALQAITEDSSLDDLRSTVAILEGKLSGRDVATVADGEVAELADAQEQLHSDEDRAQEEHANARATLQAARKQEDRTREKLSEQNLAVAKLAAELGNKQARLADFRKRMSDDDVAGRLEELGEKKADSDKEAQALADRLEVGGGEAIELRLLNLRQAVPAKTDRLKALEDRNVELSALLKDRGDEGVFDRVQTLEADLQSATVENERVERRARAAELLRNVLIKHKQHAQEQYVRPFEQGIDRWGRTLFGADFAVQVDRDLSIVSRTLNGVAVPFSSLSAGAKEQLALLGRLVCASLVDSSSGAPVVLDDSLGFADPDRLAGLNLILNSVGQDSQVIVLTCQRDRFEDVGSASFIGL